MIDYNANDANMLMITSFSEKAIMNANLLPLISKDELYRLWVPIAPVNMVIEGYEAITISPLFALPLYINLVPINVSLKELCVSSGGLP